MTTERIESYLATHLLQLFVLLQHLVIFFCPLRQFIHIISTGNKLSILSIEPVGSIRTATCRQDGCTVLIRHTDHFRLKICMHSDLVADGRGQQITRRHAALLPVIGAHRIHAVVLRAIYLLPVNHKVIATYTMESRRRTRIDRCMADGCNRWHIVNETIVTRITFVHQTAKTILTILVIIARQIIPSHLVYNDTYHELRTLVYICVSHDLHRRTKHHSQ